MLRSYLSLTILLLFCKEYNTIARKVTVVSGKSFAWGFFMLREIDL